MTIYTEQNQAFKSRISYIQETITAEKAVLIQKTEAHPYRLIYILYERLKKGTYQPRKTVVQALLPNAQAMSPGM